MKLLVSKEEEEEEDDLTEENKQHTGGFLEVTWKMFSVTRLAKMKSIIPSLEPGIKLCVTRLGKLVCHKYVQNYKYKT